MAIAHYNDGRPDERLRCLEYRYIDSDTKSNTHLDLPCYRDNFKMCKRKLGLLKSLKKHIFDYDVTYYDKKTYQVYYIEHIECDTREEVRLHVLKTAERFPGCTPDMVV